MPFSSLSKASKFHFQWEALDGLDLQGRLVARTGQIGTFDRGGTAGAALTQDVNGKWFAPGYKTPCFYHHYDASSALWTPRGVLMRGARTNSVPGSCSFADATYWAGNTDFTIATATSCILGQTAYKHTNNNAAANRSRNQRISDFVNGQTDCAWFILENVSAVTTTIGIYDGNAAAFVHSVDFTWSTATVATNSGSGGKGVISLGGGRYLVWVTATGTAAGTGAAGHTRYSYCYVTGTTQNALAAILHHGQFEANASFPSIPIVSVAAAVTRSADAL